MKKQKINGTIYIIKQISTGKCYIGQTKNNPYERMKQHFNNNYPDDFHTLLRSKPEDFSFQILRTNISNQSVLDQFECYYIGYYNSIANGFNKSMGGTLNNLAFNYLPYEK